MKYLLVAAALLAVSCASAPPEKSAPKEEPADTKLKPDASMALATCRQKLDTYKQVHPDDRVRYAVDACRGIWLEPACSDSFESALEMPSFRRASHILEACRDAYCPSIEEDLALCTATLGESVSLLEPLDESGTDPLEAWTEFNAVIFRRDYAADPREQYFSSFPSTLLQIVVVAE